MSDAVGDSRFSPSSGPAAVGAAAVVIEPPKGWRSLELRELWRYRELLYFLTLRDVKAQYKQTVIGAAWAIVRPIVSMVIFSVIFGQLAGVPSEGLPYPVFVLSGLLPWMLLSGGVQAASQSLMNQAHLLTKVYFPRLLLPMASVGNALVDFALSLLVYTGLMLWFGQRAGAGLLLLPALVLLTLLLALGLGFVLASLTVVYRDFRHAVPFMLQAWMYLSPVIYPASLVPPQYRWLLAMNPAAGLISGFRAALLNQPLDEAALAVTTICALLAVVLGALLFRRAERRFADVA